MAYHGQELGPEPLQFLQGLHVLQGHDAGLHTAIIRANGCGVHESGHLASVGDLEDELLGAYRLARAQSLGNGEFLQGDLPPIGSTDRHDFQEILGIPIVDPEALQDPDSLPVE